MKHSRLGKFVNSANFHHFRKVNQQIHGYKQYDTHQSFKVGQWKTWICLPVRMSCADRNWFKKLFDTD